MLCFVHYHIKPASCLLDSSVEKELQEAIDTDLGRTFPDNVYFQNDNQEDKKKNLRNVLVAFGRHNPKVCYCQVSTAFKTLILLNFTQLDLLIF